MQLTRNFFLYEFACKCGCGAEHALRPDILANALLLQELRDDLNGNPELETYRMRLPGRKFSLRILSGVRCADHNRNSGGAPRSFHLAEPGRYSATDITCIGLPTEILYREASRYFQGCIYYKGRHFVHTDRRGGDRVHFVQGSPDTPDRAQQA